MKKIVDTPVTQDLFCDFWQAVQQYRETGEIAWAQRARRAMLLAVKRLVDNPDYHITWPEADVRTEARLDMTSDPEAYHVVIELLAEEVTPAPGVEPFRREQRFERSFPRHLA